jgi:murein DD-endopeptidase MepM/ murein hydrolase activator NlpD
VIALQLLFALIVAGAPAAPAAPVQALTAELGRALQITVPHEPGIQSVDVDWRDKRVPFARVNDRWVTVVGIDLDVKPGEQRTLIHVRMQDGRVDDRGLTIQVKDVSYPTTELKVPDQFVQLSPANQERAAKEGAEINAIYAAITPEILWKDPFTVPIPGGSGRNFGHRRVFNGEHRAPHAGADLRATTGTPILSTNRGRVVLAKNLFFTGNTVVVDHGLGIYSLYAHLSRVDVKKGAMVAKGERVGLAGATGRVTGPHLHWGVRIQGARVDPFSLVELQ